MTAPVPVRPAIRCHGLDAGYGLLTVVRGVDLEVEPGGILAVLGPNGAGKTTLLMALAGFLTPRSGSIEVLGSPVKLGSPRRMNRAGVVLVPDSRALFTELTLAQNLQLACPRRSHEAVLDAFPALRRRLGLRAGQLSGGEQQMLAIARALVQQPKVLMIDEMSMGLAPVVVESIIPVIRQAAEDSGTAVILVEQHVQLALEMADEALVLVHGQVAARGRAVDFRRDAHLLESVYLAGPDGNGSASAGRLP
jgi:branched-chain amino acid transport system ATP-binding protein